MTSTAGAAAGTVRLWLRLEGLTLLLVALLLFGRGGHSWLLFAILFLAPDVSLLGYLAGPRVGAVSYNTVHSYVGPLLLAAGLLLSGRPLAVALIWAAHVGFDRALGYGLKYSAGFSHTHLGTIGRQQHS